MSVEAMSWVFKNATVGGTDKLVLLGVANHDGDGGSWPTIRTLAEYASVTERAVQKAISRLVKDGWLKVERNAGGNRSTRADRRPNRYTLLNGRGDVLFTPHEKRGEPGDADGVNRGTPKPSLEPSNTNARAPHLTGIAVPTEAERLCQAFADHVSELPGGKRPTVTDEWRTDMDRLLRIDGRDFSEVAEMLQWLRDDPGEVAGFWRPNIQSPKKLRQKWTTIVGQQVRERRKSGALDAEMSATLERLRGA